MNRPDPCWTGAPWLLATRDFAAAMWRRAAGTALLLVTALHLAAAVAAAQTITFVQRRHATPASASTLTVTFASAQIAGNLNVVMVGWNDATSTVTSVTDTKGNIYTLAAGPTVQPGVQSQAIYYAPNIVAAAAGVNRVTVTFNTTVSYPDVRIAEYAGLALVSPLEAAAGAFGTGSPSTSGSIVTTSPTVLLVGANYVEQGTTGPGSGFTSRIVTGDGNIHEDRVVTAAGSYSASANLTGGRWVMQVVAFRAAPTGGDTQAPTAPAGLTATAASSAQVNLAWTAATDNVGVAGYRVERCTGAGCSTFTQIAAPTGTTYSDTTVAASTSYSYRVRAIDAAGNLGPYSGTATATTPAATDTQPPTAPGGLAAAAISSTQINLTWTAATDNVGVTGYRVERCTGSGCSNFAQIATPTSTAYSDTTAAASTSYSYRVRATDAAGNLGPYSATASATTPAGADTQAPTAPGSLSATAASSTQINLTWTAATDNVGVTGYRVERCAGSGCSGFAQVGTTAVLSYADATVAASTSYTYRVRAADAAGNLGPYSGTSSATTPAGTPPSGISYAQHAYAVPPSATTVTVTYAAAQAAGNLNVVVVGWNDASSSVTSVTDTSGNSYALAAPTTVQPGVQSQAIYYAANIVAAGAGANAVRVTFNNAVSYPDVRVAEYAGLAASSPVEGAAGAFGTGTTANSGSVATASASVLLVGATYVQQGTEAPGAGFTSRVITSPNGSILEDRTVTAPGSYSATATISGGGWVMQVVAFRAPPAGGDTQAPTAPGALTATATASTQIDLTWTAATDNVGVTGYRVDRCAGAGCSNFLLVGTTATLSYSDTGVAGSTTYSYRVRASDAAGNLGPYSATASATTPAGPPSEGIAYVQHAYAVPSPTAPSVTVTYAGAQTAGNLNVVVVGWSSPASLITGVSDTMGNVYSLAGAPTIQTGMQAQAIYYASNIVGAGAGANTVTVTFSGPVSYPDVRIAEYAGLAPVDALEGSVGAFGVGGTANSGTVVTASANVLLVGGSYVQQTTTGPGAGFTSRVITSPNGSILEDRVVTAPGSYGATAAVSGGGWVMQVAAFRAAPAGGDTQPPSAPTNLTAVPISNIQIDLAWTASTDNVAVAGYRIERCAGAGCTSFIPTVIVSATSYRDDTLVGGTVYRYRVRATDGVNWSGYSNIVTATTPSNPPPTITMTAPAPGASLSGTVTLQAVVGGGAIGGVQFQVDGVNVGPVVTGPYSWAFNTALFGNGTHTIGAYAWNSDRSLGSAPPVSVTLSNASPGNPAQTGLWSPVYAWPLVAVHTSLLRNGQVVSWDRMSSGNPDPVMWDPITTSFVTIPTGDGANLFCAGHITLPDGRLFSAGGHYADHVGAPFGRIFNPSTNQWTATPDMTFGRWYPTLTTLPDGRILTLAGETTCDTCNALVPEIYNPSTNTWSQLPGASLDLPYYPHSFVLPDGRVLVTATTEAPVPTRVLNVSTQAWTVIDSRPLNGYSTAMYLPGKFLKSGTATNSMINTASSANAYLLDMTVGSPAWRQVPSMAFPRAYHVLTVLPDGTVLATGGGRTTGDYDVDNAVYPAELWSPSAESWTTLAAMQKPRLYHGVALLLQDGRVLVSGGGRSPGPDPRDQENAEIFAPPYLFKGPRPRITAAPSGFTWGQNFTVQTPDASRISRVTLVAVGGVTHGINMNQRFLSLTFTAGAGSLTVTAPSGRNLAPPGAYMLFAIDNLGVPSVASMVMVN